jgi:hypothetical protein
MALSTTEINESVSFACEGKTATPKDAETVRGVPRRPRTKCVAYNADLFISEFLALVNTFVSNI